MKSERENDAQGLASAVEELQNIQTASALLFSRGQTIGHEATAREVSYLAKQLRQHATRGLEALTRR